MLYPDENACSSPIELIPKGVNIVAIIQCGGLWFANGKFGCTWRLFQAVVQPKMKLGGTCLIKVSPAAKTALAATNDSEETGMVIEDDEDEVEEQPTRPVPVPQVVVPQVVVPQVPVPPAPQVVAPQVAVPAAEPVVVKKKIVRKKD